MLSRSGGRAGNGYDGARQGGVVAFDKFDPERSTPDEDFASAGAERRAWLLRWGWRISTAYMAIGFGFIVYWIATGQ